MKQSSKAVTGTGHEKFDVDQVRADFPVLQQEVNGFPLVYLDNGASSQKPVQVIEAVDQFYRHDYANVHRGIHALSERATNAFEAAREKVRAFINAGSEKEVIFVRGTTEAINLVAQAYARPRLGSGDEIVITEMEHHSNIVPWQLVCEQTGAVLRVVPIDQDGDLRLDWYEDMLTERTRLVAVTHISNVLGTINPVREMIDMAHSQDIPVLLDGAQAIPHMKIDVQSLECDFYAFSGHKMYGPTGIGILYGRHALLEVMPPYHGGGEMIRSVSFEKTTYNDLPHKFEAGTPHIAGAVGIGAAIDYLNSLDMSHVAAHEIDLLGYAHGALGEVSGLRIVGNAREKASIVSFTLDGVHPHDIATVLDHQYGIAVRAGHHCAMPLMKRLEVPATTRASFGLYNTRQEIDKLVSGLITVREMFA